MTDLVKTVFEDRDYEPVNSQAWFFRTQSLLESNKHKIISKSKVITDIKIGWRPEDIRMIKIVGVDRKGILPPIQHVDIRMVPGAVYGAYHGELHLPEDRLGEVVAIKIPKWAVGHWTISSERWDIDCSMAVQ